MGWYAQMKKEQYWEAMAGDVRMMKLLYRRSRLRDARWKPFFKRRDRALGEKILALALKLWAARGFGWKMTASLDRGGGVEWDGKVGTSWTI